MALFTWGGFHQLRAQSSDLQGSDRWLVHVLFVYAEQTQLAVPYGWSDVKGPSVCFIPDGHPIR